MPVCVHQHLQGLFHPCDHGKEHLAVSMSTRTIEDYSVLCDHDKGHLVVTTRSSDHIQRLHSPSRPRPGPPCGRQCDRQTPTQGLRRPLLKGQRRPLRPWQGHLAARFALCTSTCKDCSILCDRGKITSRSGILARHARAGHWVPGNGHCRVPLYNGLSPPLGAIGARFEQEDHLLHSADSRRPLRSHSPRDECTSTGYACLLHDLTAERWAWQTVALRLGDDAVGSSQPPILPIFSGHGPNQDPERSSWRRQLQPMSSEPVLVSGADPGRGTGRRVGEIAAIHPSCPAQRR